MLDKNPRTLLVSGGSKGLGEQMVRRFLKNGYRVATFSRSRSPFIEEMQSLDPQGLQFFWQALDINNLNELDVFVTETIRRFSSIDILINNAASLSEGLLPMLRDSEVQKLINTNIVAPIILTKACTRFMLRQKNGVILNLSSINSVRGHRGVSIYSATKAAMDGLTRSLARELAPSNIRVNSLAPGFFDTDLVIGQSAIRREQILKRTPLGRLADIDEITDTAMFLCSDQASFITGQTIIVDGGMTC